MNIKKDFALRTDLPSTGVLPPYEGYRIHMEPDGKINPQQPFPGVSPKKLF